MTVFRVFFSGGVMVILPWNQINRGRNFSVNLIHSEFWMPEIETGSVSQLAGNIRDEATVVLEV